MDTIEPNRRPTKTGTPKTINAYAMMAFM
jgi:hypothetical protein